MNAEQDNLRFIVPGQTSCSIPLLPISQPLEALLTDNHNFVKFTLSLFEIGQIMSF